jgi:hypothetical protein
MNAGDFGFRRVSAGFYGGAAEFLAEVITRQLGAS